jgi:hypothetical protein
MMRRAREAGTPDSCLRAIVDLMRRRGIPPAEASEASGGSSDAPAPADSASAPDEVATAIAISNAISARPAATDSALQANSLTREGLDSLLFRIAADSAMSVRYTAGLR